MSFLINNSNVKNKFSNTVAIKKKPQLIKKFKLSTRGAYYIDFYLIINNVYINNSIVTLNIKLNI